MSEQTLSEFIEDQYQEWSLERNLTFGNFMAKVILDDITGFLDLMGQAYYGEADVPDADSKKE